MCVFSPLCIGLRAAGVFRRVVRWRGNGWNKLLKVHHVTEKCILRSGAFWVYRTGAMRSKLQQTKLDDRNMFHCNIILLVNLVFQCKDVHCAFCLTRCSRSREKIWMLQVTVDRVQIMVERILRPQALNSKSCTHIYSNIMVKFSLIQAPELFVWFGGLGASS